MAGAVGGANNKLRCQTYNLYNLCIIRNNDLRLSF